MMGKKQSKSEINLYRERRKRVLATTVIKVTIKQCFIRHSACTAPCNVPVIL